jgi:hypothetical protein
MLPLFEGVQLDHVPFLRAVLPKVMVLKILEVLVLLLRVFIEITIAIDVAFVAIAIANPKPIVNIPD